MKLHSVDSNMIEAIGYDPEQYVLRVVYNGGKAYDYSEVSPEVWVALSTADSVGNYIMQHIVDVFPETEVD